MRAGRGPGRAERGKGGGGWELATVPVEFWDRWKDGYVKGRESRAENLAASWGGIGALRNGEAPSCSCTVRKGSVAGVSSGMWGLSEYGSLLS